MIITLEIAKFFQIKKNKSPGSPSFTILSPGLYFSDESEAIRAQRIDDNRYVVGNKDLSYKPGMNAHNLRLYVVIGLIINYR